MKQVILWCLMLVAGFVVAQEEHSDPEAKQLLDALTEKLEKLDQARIEFSLTMNLANSKPEDTEGVLWQKGEKFALDSKERAMYNDGNSIWIHNKRNNEVQINDVDLSDDISVLSPASLFATYRNDQYICAITDRPTEQGIKKIKIDFKPKSREAEYAKVSVYLKKNGKELDRMTVFGKDASRYTMIVKNIDTGVNIKDEKFRFDASAHPDIHVEDLRID